VSCSLREGPPEESSEEAVTSPSGLRRPLSGSPSVGNLSGGSVRCRIPTLIASARSSPQLTSCDQAPRNFFYINNNSDCTRNNNTNGEILASGAEPINTGHRSNLGVNTINNSSSSGRSNNSSGGGGGGSGFKKFLITSTTLLYIILLFTANNSVHGTWAEEINNPLGNREAIQVRFHSFYCYTSDCGESVKSDEVSPAESPKQKNELH